MISEKTGKIFLFMMNFYYNVIDWIGGYPYEYASQKKIVSFVESHGFALQKFRKPVVPTGCNEFVFEKKTENS